MTETQHKTPLPIREASMLGRIARGVIGAVIAALAGLAGVVVVVMLAWGAVHESSLLIAPIVGVLLGAILHRLGDWPARVLGGGVGGAVAGFFAISAGEAYPPGSAAWAGTGSILGAFVGIPVAAVIAVMAGLVVGLVRRRTSRGGEQQDGRTNG
jgi:hypothetical protein